MWPSERGATFRRTVPFHRSRCEVWSGPSRRRSISRAGWAGFDCTTPLCRHLQYPSGYISACENGGVCKYKDTCSCIQAPSMLTVKYDAAPGGMTGWTGTDCAMPMCVQGYFDPFCTDLPQAPGGEGCYRCANGGNCTAPDACTCAESRLASAGAKGAGVGRRLLGRRRRAPRGRRRCGGAAGASLSLSWSWSLEGRG